MLECTARQLAFVGPHQVICPRFNPGHPLNHALQAHPEPHHLQGVVTPAGGDAEVGFMGCYMVDPMMQPGEDQVPVLQPHHSPREARVRVRPLVDLVGEGDEQTQHQEEAVQGVVSSDLILILPVDQERHEGEGREGHQAIVTVGLNEVVSRDGQWVHMVLSEGTDERLQCVERERGTQR